MTDNLDATLQEDFKKEMREEDNKVPWYGPAQLTDDCWPLDDGAGRNDNVNIGYEMEEWMEDEDNSSYGHWHPATV